MTRDDEKNLLQRFDAKPAIQTHAETADWPYREEAKFWYGGAKEMDKRFFNGLVYPDGSKVPAPAIAFDDLGNQKTVACYDLYPDEYGIIGKITFNTAYYAERLSSMDIIEVKIRSLKAQMDFMEGVIVGQEDSDH